jgi:LPXTG-motif cell wall-anchored protein
MKKVDVEYVKEKQFRWYGKMVSWLLIGILFCLGFFEGVTGLEFPMITIAGLGLLLLAGLSVYFFFKGRHYSIEKDNTGLYLAIIMFVLYLFTADVVIALLVGPVQYVVGRGVSLGRK